MVGPPEGEQSVAAGSASVVSLVGVAVDRDGAADVDTAVSVDDDSPAHPAMSVIASTVAAVLRLWSRPVTPAACSLSVSNV
ncbi:MAG: hypothetical protein HY828_01185 [Actinobacteria bacterium]|nr:hypothetical protein [Actinomycetota bacterium]